MTTQTVDYGRFTFTPSTKTGSNARLAFTGPTGAGKTFTSLTLARALGPNPGIIDADHQRSRKYSDRFGFKRIDMDRYDPSDLIRAVLAAGAQNINPLIIDTMSPFWSGTDGMLDRVGQEKTSFEGWRKMRPIERTMLDAILGYPGHIIANMKVKTQHVVEPNADGKMVPRAVGLAPEQTAGMGSEFDIVFDMAEGGVARVGSTCLCPELTGKVFTKPDETLAETILAWLTRNAIGDPLNPITTADWAMEPGRTRGELRDRRAELKQAGQLGAIVLNPFRTEGADEFIPIAVLIDTIGKRLVAEDRAASAAQQQAVTG